LIFNNLKGDLATTWIH